MWEIMSDWESLEALGGFDRKWLKACGRQDPRKVPAPPRSWNKDQVVIWAECCVCRQGPSPCQGSSTAPNSHIVALFAELLAGLGGAVLHPSSLRDTTVKGAAQNSWIRKTETPEKILKRGSEHKKEVNGLSQR